MEILLNWLREGIQPGQFWLYVFYGTALTFAYDIIGMSIFLLFKIEPTRQPPALFLINKKELSKIKEIFQETFFVVFFSLFLLFCMAALEEFLFRLPLALVTRLFGPTGWVLLPALILSVIFGWIHGGPMHLIIQGVPGFFWCLLFLKCGGFQGNYWTAFWVVAFVHFFTNLIIIIGNIVLEELRWQVEKFKSPK